jgi:hypothetical protein
MTADIDVTVTVENSREMRARPRTHCGLALSRELSRDVKMIRQYRIEVKARYRVASWRAS